MTCFLQMVSGNIPHVDQEAEGSICCFRTTSWLLDAEVAMPVGLFQAVWHPESFDPSVLLGVLTFL